MKRFCLIVLTLILIVLDTLGQTHFIGILGGVNRANIYAKDMYDHPYWHLNSHNPRIGFSGGLNYEYHFSDKYYLGVDLLYDQLGNKNPMFTIDQNGVLSSEIHWYRWNYDFFSLPVKFGFIVGNKVKVFTNIGVCPSYLFQAYSIVPQYDNNIFTEDKVYLWNSFSQKFDLGGVVEAGISYPFLEDFSIFTSLRYRKGIIPYRADKTLYDSIKMHHNALNCSIGIRFRLKSN
jgi:hypothetical protein